MERQRKIVVFLLLLLFTLNASAKHILGSVQDKETGEFMEAVTVQLLQLKDSSVISTDVTSKRKLFFGHAVIVYELEVPGNGDYLLKFSYLGYKTLYKKVKVDIARQMNEQFVEPVTLEPEGTTLNTVTVKATKIKMVMHGDTIVYNADAFKLSQGSMLDALIRQMPGATLDDEGVIKVNGKTVSSLLVNGRNFFKGNPKQALENLPAYTVDKVKVYNKKSLDSKLMNRRMDKDDYVLDVGLKKQYRHNAIVNTDLAAGTNNRYLAKVFAMTLTENSKFNLTTTANNVDADSNFGPEGELTEMPDATGGKKAEKNLDASYHWEDKNENYVDAGFQMSHSDGDLLQRTSEQTFLTGGDYYNLDRSQTYSRQSSYQGNFSFQVQPKHKYITGNMNFSYSQNRSKVFARSGQFDADASQREWLDSIFMPTADSTLLKHVVNRVKRDYTNYGQQLQLSTDYYLRLKLADHWMLNAYTSASYSHNKSTAFNINQVDYLNSATPSDHRYQFTDAPSNGYRYVASSELDYVSGNDSSKYSFVPSLSYSFSQNYNGGNNFLYRLDKLAGYAETNYQLGVLPSARENLQQVLDVNNSYRQRLYTYENNATLHLQWGTNGWNLPHRIWIDFRLPVKQTIEHLRYYRADNFTRNRTTWFVEPSLRMYYTATDSVKERGIQFAYDSQQQQPDITSLLNISDDSDPLRVSLGNPHLKLARTHNVGINYSVMRPRQNRYNIISLSYYVTQDAIANRVSYDKSTGKTLSQMVNVNGNWVLALWMVNRSNIGKSDKFSFENNAGVNYNRNVDLTSVSGTDDNGRSIVRTWKWNDNLKLEYRTADWLHLSLLGSISQQIANSHRSGFDKIHATNFHYGMRARVTLPWKMELTTNLTEFSRRGYATSDMNTNELVWNGRITQTLCKGNVMLALDGYDLLGRLKTTTATINAQGRTETWTNSIPRYVMFHVVYRFNRNGRKGNRAPSGYSLHDLDD